jgi:hypothetical protein
MKQHLTGTVTADISEEKSEDRLVLWKWIRIENIATVSGLPVEEGGLWQQKWLFHVNVLLEKAGCGMCTEDLLLVSYSPSQLCKLFSVRVSQSCVKYTFRVFFLFFWFLIFFITYFPQLHFQCYPKSPPYPPPQLPYPPIPIFLALAFPCTGAYKVCMSIGPLFPVMDTITSNVCSVQWTVIKNTAASFHCLSAVESRDTHYVEKEFKLEASVMPLPWSSENPLESRMKDSRSHGPLNHLSRTLWVHEGLRGKHRLTSVCTRFSVYMLLLWS